MLWVFLSGVEWSAGVSGSVCHWVKGRVVFLESWGWWREREREREREFGSVVCIFFYVSCSVSLCTSR